MKYYLFKMLFPSFFNINQIMVRENNNLKDFLDLTTKENNNLKDEIRHHNTIIGIYRDRIIPKNLKSYECDHCGFYSRLPSHFCPACDKDSEGKTKSDYK